MKPVLILGLGNILAGDDGIGLLIAELLGADPAVTASADVIVAGSDLLRFSAEMAGRSQVILVDAAESSEPPGTVSVIEHQHPDDTAPGAHSLSAPQIVELLRTLTPEISAIRFTWVLVSVAPVKLNAPLSREALGAIPAALEWIGNRIRENNAGSSS